MLPPMTFNNEEINSNTIDLLYQLCKENEVEKLQEILPFIGNINIINQIQTASGSTCLHVACYYGHSDVVKILLEHGAASSIRNLRHNLTPYEEATSDDIKKILVDQRKAFSTEDYNYIEWSMIGNDLLEKRREFRQAMDLYKTYDNHHLISRLLVEVIQYYLNEYLVNTDNSNQEIIRKQIETIEKCLKEATETQDYLTYFIKAYTLTNIFYKVLNQDLALYVLEYFDPSKRFSFNYRLVNCLVHIVTLLMYHPKLPQYQYQGLCHRGMRITSSDLDQYQLNQHILNRALLSTSTDQEVAEMFAGAGQQSQMRYTPKDHCALQYSCLCHYLIKQSSTAINIESLSARPDEKEVLIIPFTVFKVTAIRRNDRDDSTATISIEIDLEECEDLIEDKNELESSQTLNSSPLSLSVDGNMYTEDNPKFKRRKHLYVIIGIIVSIIALILIFTLVFTVALKPKNPTNAESDAIEYQLPPGCPSVLDRSSWNARPYTNRDKLTILPVPYIVVRQWNSGKTIMSSQGCASAIRELQDIHMDERKWFDIGFNFVICNDNTDQQQIYRGRGWTYIGAHCVTYNDKSLGIAVLGNYSSVKSLNTFKSFIQCGISKNIIAKNFTLVGELNATDIYSYYLEYFKDDTDLQHSNQHTRTPFFCGYH